MPSRFAVAAFMLRKHPPLAAALVLGVSFVGFGALCQGVNFGFYAASFTTMFIFALPAQVIFVDEYARGAALPGLALAVTFTAVRLLPMTVTILPYMRAPQNQNRRWIGYVASHFIAVTVWVESLRRIPEIPQPIRIAYFFCLAAVMVGVSLVGTWSGYLLAAHLSKTVAAALILLTPIYFFLSLFRAAKTLSDAMPLALGFLSAPLFMYLVPGLDLAFTGLVVGTVNFFFLRRDKPSPALFAMFKSHRDER